MSEDKFKVYADDYASTKTLSISNFLGVDYYTPELSVADYHAIDMQNLAYKSGVVQVRNGYVDLINITQQAAECSATNGWDYVTESGGKDTYGMVNPSNYNGIYKFSSSDNKTHTLIHIGYLMYEVVFPETSEDKMTLTSIKNGSNYRYKFNDHKSSGFVKDDKLYILDGEKYRYIKYTEKEGWIVNNVEEDDDTYIPTTTIGIVPANSEVSSRQTLDDVNLMTMWRKNTFITGLDDSSDDGANTTWTYYLDTYCCNKVNDKNIQYISDVSGIEIEIELAIPKVTTTTTTTTTEAS